MSHHATLATAPLPGHQKSLAQRSNPLLYVEDEENDVQITKIGLKMAGITHPLVVTDDGQRAIEYLSGSGKFADRRQFPLPCVVLLDLNLPGVSGMEVLAWARSQPQLGSMPIIIFTSSDQPADRQRARELGADDYIVKPSELRRLKETLQDFKARWLDHHCG